MDMTSRNRILFVFTLLIAGTICKPLECSWTSPSGEFYDFSGLKRDSGYQIKDTSSTMGMFDLIYVTNVCETVQCQNTDVSLFQGLEILGKVTSNCDILTHANPPTYSYINPDQPGIGVQWQYSGAQCTLPPKISYDEQNNLVQTPVQSNEIHSSTFQIFCSEDGSETFTVDASQNCHLTLKMTSPLGCIGASQSRYIFFKILLCIIVVAAVYFVGGSQINTRKYGLTGIESLPHHAFWTDIPNLVNDGFRFSLLQMTSALRYFKAKGQGSAEGSAPGTYNTI